MWIMETSCNSCKKASFLNTQWNNTVSAIGSPQPYRPLQELASTPEALTVVEMLSLFPRLEAHQAEHCTLFVKVCQ